MLKHMFEYGTIHKENRKKYDLILVSVVVFAALILWGILRLIVQPGDVLCISYDGEALGQVSLNGSEDRYYLFLCGNTELLELTDSQAEACISGRKSLQGQEPMQGHVPELTGFSASEDYNLFVCRKDGTVRMLAASCPDQICVNHREIKTSMDNIICLPHRLVLEIISDRESRTGGLDGIAY